LPGAGALIIHRYAGKAEEKAAEVDCGGCRGGARWRRGCNGVGIWDYHFTV